MTVLKYTPNLTIEDAEKWLIEAALKHFNGNKTKAAKSMGVSVRTLREKVKHYDLYDFINEPRSQNPQSIYQKLKEQEAVIDGLKKEIDFIRSRK